MPKPPSIHQYAKKAIGHGAVGAKIIDTKTIVAATWVRMKCQFGCGGYGLRLTCPPHSPAPEQTRTTLTEYSKALLIHGTGHENVTKIAATLERRAFLDGYYKAFAMGSGPCRLCKQCNIDDGECRHPDKARPAMEACGIDVYKTALNNRLPIEVVKNHRSRQDYYALVLLQ